MGIDGGMNPTFMAAVKSHGGPGNVIHTASGTIPPHVNPPGFELEAPTGSSMSLASSESKPAPAPAPRSSVQVASATSAPGGFFGSLFGSRNEEPPAPAPEASAPKTKPAAATKLAHSAGAIRPKSEPQPANTKTAGTVWPKPPAVAPRQEAEASKPESKPESSLLNGAAPTVPTGGFENRFGAWR